MIWGAVEWEGRRGRENEEEGERDRKRRGDTMVCSSGNLKRREGGFA